MSRIQRKSSGKRIKTKRIDVKGTNAALNEALKKKGLHFDLRDVINSGYRRRKTDTTKDSKQQ